MQNSLVKFTPRKCVCIADDAQQEFLDQTFLALIKMLQSNKVSGPGRDSAMELIIKNMLRNDGVQWTKKFLDSDGLYS